jgi:hypothetical protein
MTRASIVLLTFAASIFALGGCASSFEAVDRSATAFNQRMVDEERCYSRPEPNGQTLVGCNFTTTSTDTTTTVTTTDSEGRVTSTTTTRTVNGKDVPQHR